MPKAIIVGATSGIGKEVALQLLAKGWEVGIAGRRTERLEEIKAKAPEKIRIRRIDVRSDDAASDLLALIADLGGMDLYVHCSGIGCVSWQTQRRRRPQYHTGPRLHPSRSARSDAGDQRLSLSQCRTYRQRQRRGLSGSIRA